MQASPLRDDPTLEPSQSKKLGRKGQLLCSVCCQLNSNNSQGRKSR